MVANVSYNPNITTVSAGLFNIQSTGLVQGTAFPDPAIRFKLASGLLATTETLPMWGGVGIFTDIPGVAGGPATQLGTIVGRATAVGNLIAFSVFDQAYGMINTPQSPVPLAGSSMQVMYYRLGSGARIAVKAAPAIASDVGSLTNLQVSWDFVNQQLIPFIAAYVSASVSSATYTSSTGILSLTFSAAPFGAGIGSGANGVYISLSGLTTSAGSASNVNGDFPITSTGSSGTVINVQAAALLGTITINSSTGTLAAGGGALACQVLQVETASNSQSVNYNATTGFATWNFADNLALILI